MKIGIVSDSHGNIENLKRAFHEIKDKLKCDLFIHLGDDYGDIKKAGIALSKNVICVPGVFHKDYTSKDMEQRIIKKIEGLTFLITHSRDKHKNDPDWLLDPEEAVEKKQVDVVLFGHTHVPDISVNENNVIFFNPGHIKDKDKKAYPSSFGIIEIIDNKIMLKILSLFYKDILFEKIFER